MMTTDEEMAAAHAPAAGPQAAGPTAESSSSTTEGAEQPANENAQAQDAEQGAERDDAEPDAPPPPVLPNAPPKPSADMPAAGLSPERRPRTPRDKDDKKRPPHRGTTGGPGIAPAPGSGQWVNKHDITKLWPEMLARLAKDATYSASDLKIAVMRIVPDAPPYQVGHEFEASLVTGDGQQSPVDALLGVLVTYYHMKCMPQGPATYEVRWRWKTTSLDFGWCKVFFPHQSQCNHPAPDPNAQRGEYSFPGAPAPAPRAPYGPQYPPQGPQYGGQGYGGPGYQQGSGFFNQTAQPGPDPEIARLNEELRVNREQMMRDRETAAYNRAILDTLVKQNAEAAQRAAAAPPVQVATTQVPPTAGVSVAQEAANLLMSALGIKPGAPGVTVGLPNPPTAGPTTLGQDAFTTVEQAIKTVKRLRSLGPEIERAFTGDVPEATAEVVEDDDPVRVSDTGGKWRDGREMRIARNKETKNIDYVETAFHNPVVAETVMDFGNKLGGAVVAGIEKLTGIKTPESTEPEVVSSTPAGATDASGPSADAGWTK